MLVSAPLRSNSDSDLREGERIYSEESESRYAVTVSLGCSTRITLLKVNPPADISRCTVKSALVRTLGQRRQLAGAFHEAEDAIACAIRYVEVEVVTVLPVSENVLTSKICIEQGEIGTFTRRLCLYRTCGGCGALGK